MTGEEGGEEIIEVVPVPSCPKVPWPQHFTEPPISKTQECESPVAIAEPAPPMLISIVGGEYRSADATQTHADTHTHT